jgi:hypothetical protein
MSGNGGGGKRRGGTGRPDPVPSKPKPAKGGGAGGGGGGSSPCDISIDVDLEGVRPGALAGLEIGSVLTVILQPTAAFPVVMCVRPDGTVVGSLAGFRFLAQLIECLEQGVAYQVEITAMSGGNCHVQGGRI